MNGGFFTRAVPGRIVWLFANKAKMVSKALAPFDRGEVQGVDIHSVWVLIRS